ncbi:hypothetical protein ACW95P_02995 [Candidatus Mycoplasma pogonae]
MNNKKLLVGLGGGSIALLSVAMAGAIIGGSFLRKNRLDQLKAAEEKREAGLVEYNNLAKTTKVYYQQPQSVLAPEIARLTFSIPNELSGRNLTLKYKNANATGDQYKSITTYVADSDIATDVSFVLRNLTSNVVYEYKIEAAGSTSQTATTTVFESRFLTPFKPSVVSENKLGGARITVSGLYSYLGRTLHIKAVPADQFQPERAFEQFQNTFYVATFGTPPQNTDQANPTSSFDFIPTAKMQPNKVYYYMIFDNNGVVPLLDLANPPFLTTLATDYQEPTAVGYYDNAIVTLKGIANKGGTKLKLGYQKVDTDSTIFDAKKAQFINATVPSEGDEFEILLQDLKPNSNYKYAFYSIDDEDNKYPLFTDGRINRTKDLGFKTNALVKMSYNLEDKLTVWAQSQPVVEARATKITFEGLKDYSDAAKFVVKILPKSQNDWTKAIMPVEWAAATSTSGATASTPADGYTALFLGLTPNTDYKVQIFAPNGTTVVIKDSHLKEFKTLIGLTKEDFSITPKNLGVDGQAKVVLKFKASQNAEVWKPLYRQDDTTPSTTPTNQLKLRVFEVVSPEEVLNWKQTATKEKEISVTFKAGVDGAADTYEVTDQEIEGLKEGTLYKAALFLKNTDFAPISEEITFRSNYKIQQQNLATSTKVLFNLSELNTYIGKELHYTLTQKSSATSAVKVAEGKFTPVANQTQQLVFEKFEDDKHVEPGTEYELKVFIANPDYVEPTPPAADATAAASATPTPTKDFELLKASSATSDSAIFMRPIDNYTNPTSFLLEVTSAKPLYLKDVSVAYRKAGTEAWTFLNQGISESKDKFQAPVFGVEPKTEYEVNLVWNVNTAVTLLDQNVKVTTKAFVTLTQSELGQVSAFVAGTKLNTFPNQNLILKWWEIPNATVSDEEKAALPTQTSTGATELAVPKDVTDTKSLGVMLTGLYPNKNYAYQLFNGSQPVSEMGVLTTEKQLEVLTNQTESFTSAFKVTLGNADKLPKVKDDQYIFVVRKKTDTDFKNNVVKYWKFNKSQVTGETLDVLIYGLDDATSKEYTFNVFAESDAEYATPLMTPKNPEQLNVNLLSNTDVPKLKVETTSDTGALFEFTQLGKFIGKKLVIKYRTQFWNENEVKDVELKKTEVITGTSLNYQLTDLTPNTKYWYEVFVDVNGDTDHVTLLQTFQDAAAERKWFETKSKVALKKGTEFVLAKTAKFDLLKLKQYKEKSLVLKAVPAPTSGEANFKGEGVVTTQPVKITADDDTTTQSFNFANLKPNTQYVFQAFVSGLDQPLLENNGSFTTRGEIRGTVGDLSATRLRVLISGLDTYVGVKLKLEVYEHGTDGTKPTTATKTVEINVQNKDVVLGTNSIVPVVLEKLQPGRKYSFEIKAEDTNASSTTTSTNLFVDPAFSATTFKNAVKLFALAKGANPQETSPAAPTTTALATTTIAVQFALKDFADLKGKEVTLKWKDKTDSKSNELKDSYEIQNSVTFTVPTTNEAFFVISELDKKLETGKTYEFVLETNSDSKVFTKVDSLLNSGTLVEVVGTKLKLTDPSEKTLTPTFNKVGTLASSLTTKAKFDEKYTVTETQNSWTVEVQDNKEETTSAPAVKAFIANDKEGILYVLVHAKQDDVTLEYWYKLTGFKKDSPTPTPPAPATPTT